MTTEEIKKEIDDIEFALATMDPEHITGGMQSEAEKRLMLLKKILGTRTYDPRKDGGMAILSKFD